MWHVPVTLLAVPLGPTCRALAGGFDVTPVGLARVMSVSQPPSMKVQAAMQRRSGRRNASSEPSSRESDPSQTFTEYCNQRRIGYDKTFLWCCLAVLVECYARFSSSFTPWGLASMAAFTAWVLAALLWAYCHPSSYAVWRQPVLAFLRISRWVLPWMHTIQLALLEQEPTRYGGGGRCYAALIIQALLGSGLVGVVHGSFTAPLCLPWQAAVVCAELLLVVPRSDAFCHSTSLRHSTGMKAVDAVHRFLTWLLPPWIRSATSAAAAQGAAAASSGLGGSAVQQSTSAGAGGQCDQCWAVMVMLLCSLGSVLPLVVHAVCESALFRQFAHRQRAEAGRCDACHALYQKCCRGHVHAVSLRMAMLAVAAYFGVLSLYGTVLGCYPAANLQAPRTVQHCC